MLHAIFGTGEPGVLPPGGTPESRSLSQKAAGVLGLVVVTLDVCGCVVMQPWCSERPSDVCYWL